jgi:REP element-mobilizing transposase RayT
VSTKYKIRNNERAYFITITIVGWIDVFTRLEQKENLVNSLRYCQNKKSLEIFGWCLMPSHLHMICRSGNQEIPLSSIIRDFKKFTSKAIIKTIIEKPESRRDWMLEYFANECKHLKREQKYKVWQDGYHAKEIIKQPFFEEKLDYIHHNPVKENIVEFPENYLYSSARNFAELESLIDIIQITRSLKTIR